MDCEEGSGFHLNVAVSCSAGKEGGVCASIFSWVVVAGFVAGGQDGSDGGLEDGGCDVRGSLLSEAVVGGVVSGG